MKSNKLVLLVAALLVSFAAHAGIHKDYPIHFPDSSEYAFRGEMYSIISHVVGGWNSDHVTEPGTKKFVEFNNARSISSLGFVSAYGGPERQFFAPGEVTFIVESSAGQHRLSFPNGKVFLIAGGNLSLCLCEVLRDTIRLTEMSPADPLLIVLVSDAVYDGSYNWPVSGGGARGPKFTLSSAVTAASSRSEMARIFSYVSNQVLGSGDIFCPGQNYYGFPNINKKNYTFGIYNQTQLLGTVGNGKRRVEMVISETKDLDRVIKSFGADRYYPIQSPW